MPRRIIGSIVGALAATSLLAPVASAAAPARVDVRAEAPGKTLLDTTVTTTRTKVVKDGDAAHTCSGTSAAGALERATAGKWTGTWFDGLGYAVESIRGVKAPADFSAYWTLWVNGRASTTGLCATELQAGDEVLEFLCTSTPDFSSCTNLPLDLKVTNVRGGRVTVKVVLLKGDGTSTAVAGATVTGGVKPVRTGATGAATVMLPLGQSALRATHGEDVPSARLHCQHGVHAHSRGAKCGSHDQTPPLLGLQGIPNGRVFAAASAPRLLRGIAIDSAGATVALRLTRKVGGTCTRFDAERGAFRPCARAPRAPFEVSDRSRWSFLLPAKLGTGGYRLDAFATDGAGNRRALTIRFTVLPPA